MKYKGDFEELKKLFEEANLVGEWLQKSDTQYQFQFKSGGYFNWYDSKKGTILIQGTSEEKTSITNILETFFVQMSQKTKPTRLKKREFNNKVFVVYGHDEGAKTQLETMLRRWQVEPLILDQLPSKGQTIIEKLEEYTEEVSFAVVLATPDDEGHKRGHDDEKAYRARQNVVLELGMMLKHLGRHKVAIIQKSQEKMERPSDIHGLIYIPFKENLQREAGPLLAKEMVTQGFQIEISKL